MAWEDCISHMQTAFSPTKVLEMAAVNWSDITFAALDSNTFGNPFYLICPGRHCRDGTFGELPVAHLICTCRDANGTPMPNCTVPALYYPVVDRICVSTVKLQPPSGQYNNSQGGHCTAQGETWYELTCYCCCACFANGTAVATPPGTRAVEDFAMGDRVRTALGKGQPVALTWSSAPVAFSSGSGGSGSQATMVHICHGDFGTIIVMPDHLFLLALGKLKRADRLVPARIASS